MIENRKQPILQEGKIINSSLIKITKKDCVLDIGWKSEIYVPKNDFANEKLEVGKDYQLYIIVADNGRGEVVASRCKAMQLQGMSVIQKSFEDKTTILAKIVKQVKSGYILSYQENDIFLPGSLSGDIDSLIANDVSTIEIKILRIQNTGKTVSIIGSRNNALLDHKTQTVKEFLEKTQIGDVITGLVKHHTSFGIFVDLNCIDGLVHLNDISWSRTRSITTDYPKGSTIETKVIDIQDGKISLSIKHLRPDPWLRIDEVLSPGQIHDGTICNITEYGLFVSLHEVEVEGLVHISSISWFDNRPSLSSYEVGDSVRCKVMKVSASTKRVSLSIKDITDSPWVTFNQQYPVNSKTSVTVQKITDFGIFVLLENGINGLIHISDVRPLCISSDLEKYSVGQVIECTVIAINIEKSRINLGINDTEYSNQVQYELNSTLEVVPLHFRRKDVICEVVGEATKDRGVLYFKDQNKNDIVLGQKLTVTVSENNKNDHMVFSLKTGSSTNKTSTRKIKSTLSGVLSDAGITGK